MGASPPASGPSAVPWSRNARGLTLSVRLTPKGGRDAVEGIQTLSDGRAVLKARVRAAPSEGEANAALVKLLAHALDIPSRSIAIAGGAASRAKTVQIVGDAAALEARLLQIVAAR
jgi:uncharacterized protein YggU (UPF0235/DUF167 family)